MNCSSLVKHTGCGLHVCPGVRAMSMVLSGRVMRNSSESTSVPSSSHTRARDTADRDSSRAWHTYGTDSSCSGLMSNSERKMNSACVKLNTITLNFNFNLRMQFNMVIRTRKIHYGNRTHDHLSSTWIYCQLHHIYLSFHLVHSSFC